MVFIKQTQKKHNNMPSFFRQCCFCIPLPQAFTYIIYIDLLRLLWVILSTILLFLKSEATIADYGFNALILSSVFSMNFNALKSLNHGFLRNDLKMHKKYLISKIIVWVIYLLKVIIIPKLNCSIRNDVTNVCLDQQLDAIFAIEGVWSVIDVYFLMMVVTFCKRIHQGYYGMIGATPIFINRISSSDLDCFKKAICIETKGLKIKNTKKNSIDESVLLHSVKEGKNQKKFFKIFPFPLLVSQKKKTNKTEILDLSDLESF